MAVEPKSFQKAAIKAAVLALTCGSRRFLIADEVGLGKTIVASGVVQRMSAGRNAPLTVFYVCSNSLLAHQNLGRLAEFLTDEERKTALSMVDRPSLMPTSKEPPSHPTVRLYSLSPGTAMARGGGRVEERAFAAALLRKILNRKLPRLEPGLRLAASKERFNSLVWDYLGQLDNREIGRDGLLQRFRKSLRDLLQLADGQHLPARLTAEMQDFSKLASTLRAALAIAALGAIKPDLVIFDEFQRFRDLLDPDHDESEEDADAASRVLQALRGRGADGPAILLLSATPYVPFRSRQEGGDSNATSDFYELVGFLAGERKTIAKDLVEKGFVELGEELRKGIPDPGKVVGLRATLESELRPLMCRTERSRAGKEGSAPEIHYADLLPQDVQGFRGFAEAVREKHPEWAVPLWSSVPLPMQSLGQRYQAWRGADWTKADSAVGFTERQRNGFESLNPSPHPRLRALLKVLPARQLGLPWISPSRPWWPLEGAWATTNQAVDGKLLVFSRYRATPASVAGLVSYSVETLGRETKANGLSRWEAFSKRSLLAASPERPGLLALFHPSPLLTGLDPLLGRQMTAEEVRESLLAQLTERLDSIGVRVEDRTPRERRLAPWQLVAALEEKAGLWDKSRATWTSVVKTLRDERNEPAAGRRLGAMVDRWNESRLEDVLVIDKDEAMLLVDFALEAPGVVLARALGRHWPAAVTTELETTAGFCWRALRAYLDNSLFSEILGEGQDDRYPDALRRAVRQGNLESVLDEHFWYLGQSDSRTWRERLELFASALRLRSGNTSMYESADKSFTLRCHAAMAMTEARGAKEGDADDKPVRPDEVRQAFNTPFWPHILVTTSVGQEGLDFHPWCRAIAHWDPPTGPVALEQREGRITRHAGLNVRRTLENGRARWTGIKARVLGRRLRARPVLNSPIRQGCVLGGRQMEI